MTTRNIWAEIQSHPTLLAPKMTGHITLQICSSFPGQGFVEISFLNEPLVSIDINAVAKDTNAVPPPEQDGPQVESGQY